jgi:hypothetical protein
MLCSWLEDNTEQEQIKNMIDKSTQQKSGNAAGASAPRLSQKAARLRML